MPTRTPAQTYESCDGRYSLAMQTDGNLVVYASGGSPLWASDTNGK